MKTTHLARKTTRITGPSYQGSRRTTEVTAWEHNNVERPQVSRFRVHLAVGSKETSESHPPSDGKKRSQRLPGRQWGGSGKICSLEDAHLGESEINYGQGIQVRRPAIVHGSKPNWRAGAKGGCGSQPISHIVSDRHWRLAISMVGVIPSLSSLISAACTSLSNLITAELPHLPCR